MPENPVEAYLAEIKKIQTGILEQHAAKPCADLHMLNTVGRFIMSSLQVETQLTKKGKPKRGSTQLKFTCSGTPYSGWGCSECKLRHKTTIVKPS